MKKLLSFFLVVVMLLAITACSPTQGVPNPSNDGSKPQNNNQEQNNNSNNNQQSPTEPSSTWQTKELTAPNFEELEVREMVVMQHEGRDIKGNVVVSPLTLEAFNRENALEALKNSPLFTGWTFGLEDFERGCVTLYSDVGQQNAYEWQKKIVATKEYYDTQSYFSDLNVQYSGETENTIGYTGIRVEIMIPETERNEQTQTQVFEILKAVYGEEYAEFLCYAPVKSKSTLHEIELKNATISFIRNVSENSLFFNLVIDTYCRNTFDGYAGPGDYTPITSTPEHVYDLFSSDMGDVNVQDYQNIGATMLKQNYDYYTYTVPGYTSGYTYRILTGDNGHKVVDFALDGMTGQEEVGKLVLPAFELEYEVISKDGTVTDVEGKIHCGVGLTGDGEDLNTTKKAYLQKAIACMECTLKDDVDLSNAFPADADGNYKTYEHTATILGLEKKIYLSFDFGETMADALVGYFNINF